MAILDFLSSKAGTWSAAVWDGLLRAIDARFKPLEEQLDIQRATTDAIVSRGLNVIEDELAPVVAQGQDVLTAINAVKASADDVHDDLVAMRDEGIDTGHILTDATARFTSDAEMATKATPADIAAAIAALQGGASSALDTLNELAAALGDDPDFAATIAAALGERVRHDAAQVLTATQQGRARANIGISYAEDDRIINGAFEIAQRGSSTSSDGFGGPDRWRNDLNGGTVTHEQVALTVGDTLGSNTARYVSRQAVSGQSAAANYAIRTQRIEGVHSYAGQTITILGWARRVAGTGDMAVEGVQFFGNAGTPSASVAGIGASIVALSTLWTPFAVTMDVPSIAGKTLGSIGDDCFIPHFWISGGSDWNARTNSLGIQTITVDLWGIHIRKGVVPVEAAAFYTPPSINQTLRDCQRYFYAHSIGVSSTNSTPARVYASASGAAGFGALHPVRMRAAPSAAISWEVNDVVQGSNPTVFNADGVGWEAISTGLAANVPVDVLSYTMDAEL